ncbi:membrane protein [Virgisporangium aliadipatigenens]|uniref:Membrane protein n=1 Tax=Virgisporangium aliadipatigenens TaxID=741659 RepID=A0A8J4DQB1_9ACTN|nr:phosphatidylglycerol lysyltransferase domain-containing protein [Virgisporangium aliadipatigenens]GIJ46855.1 membrane protein [Virgisporangium aliadipatigenens]
MRPPLSRLAIARLVQAGGILEVLRNLLPPAHRLAHVVPVAGMLTARAGSMAAGVLLVYLGAGLRRGRRTAFHMGVVVAGAGIVLQLAHGLDLDGAAVSAGLLALLVGTRDRFRAVGDPGGPVRAALAVAGIVGAGFTIGMLEIAVRANRLVGHPPLRDWARHVLLGMVGLDGPLRFAHPLGAAAVSVTTGTFGLLAAAVGVVRLLRPGRRRPGHTPAEERRLRALLTAHGEDSLGYFALRGDKSLLWSPSGKAAVAYRVVGAVSLAAGDPIGDPEAWPPAIGAWLADCERHGWTPAVLGCGRLAGLAYRRFGLDAVELGDEAVLDTRGFTLDGREMRSVRQAVRRVARAGFTCTVERRGALTDVAEIVAAADAMRDGPVERGFSMALSRVGGPSDVDCVLVTCRSADGRIRGVLQFVPWGDDGLSLDLMRADRSAGNGIVESMVVAALTAAPALGVTRVSLNFAVMRSVFARADELGAGPVLRLWSRALRVASRYWQLESLYRANAKYRPTWRPRYLCFPAARDLPRVALAALRAESFLP